MVQLDAMEKKVEDQVTFYQFCKNQIWVRKLKWQMKSHVC
jgi:hypothetical protein